MAKKKETSPDLTGIKIIKSGQFQIAKDEKSHTIKFVKDQELRIDANQTEPLKGDTISQEMANNLITFKMGVNNNG